MHPRYLAAFVVMSFISLGALLGFNLGGGGWGTENFISQFGAGGNPNKHGLVYMDHDVFYYGIGPSMDSAQEADVILLGNSRALFGFSEAEFMAFGKRHGLRVFNLALPGETLEIQLELFRRFNLQPKLVIANLDNNDPHVAPPFEGPTAYARNVQSRGWLENLKQVIHKHLLVRISTVVDRYAPAEVMAYFSDTLLDPHGPILSRSTITGFWDTQRYPMNKNVVFDNTLDSNCEVRRHIKNNVEAKQQRERAFAQQMRSINAHVILTVIPTASNCGRYGQAVAERIGADFIFINSPLESGDGSHLGPKGARVFSKKFIEELDLILRTRNSTAQNLQAK